MLYPDFFSHFARERHDRDAVPGDGSRCTRGHAKSSFSYSGSGDVDSGLFFLGREEYLYLFSAARPRWSRAGFSSFLFRPPVWVFPSPPKKK